MTEKRKAAGFSGLAILALIGSCFLALVFARFALPIVAAGFAAYVLCGRYAMALLHVDERVFARRTRGSPIPH
ncbi:MAG: hypothetical protein WAU32_15950 [Thermoanaerobaculia bacterium]|jgi:hypothetical protein